MVTAYENSSICPMIKQKSVRAHRFTTWPEYCGMEASACGAAEQVADSSLQRIWIVQSGVSRLPLH